MELKIISQILMLAIALLALVETSDEAYSLALPGCNNTCGDVEVPYPFGMGNSSIPSVGPCFLQLQAHFNLTCVNNSILYWGNYGCGYDVPVLDLDILHAQLELSFSTAKSCTNGSPSPAQLRFNYPSFSISNNQNKFVAIGYDSYGTVNSVFDSEVYTTGCLTMSNGNTKKIKNGTCSGIGCCQVDIPPSMKNITVGAFNLSNSENNTRVYCSYAMVVKDGYYNFSSAHLDNFGYERVPMVLDWSVGDKNCKGSEGELDEYVCGKNSYCNDTDIDHGYRCNCMAGYHGNPYHPDGCEDDNECLINHDCLENHYCHNTNGSYQCLCPEGQTGNGTKLSGCQQPNVVTQIVIGTCASFIILFVGASSLYLITTRNWFIS